MRDGWIWTTAIAGSGWRVSRVEMGFIPPPGRIKAGNEPVERGIVDTPNPGSAMAETPGKPLLGAFCGRLA